MTAKEANLVPISDYLNSKGILPSKRYRGYSMYLSPFRVENNPSFKVSDKGLWVDFGTNLEGGTLIDLVLKLFPHFRVSDAIAEIESTTRNDSISFFQKQCVNDFNDVHAVRQNNAINIYRLKVLGSNPALTEYLSSRGIRLKTAMDYCKEVYFKINDKRFFGIGTENENGWAIRNKYWKGCSGQGSSYFNKNNRELAVFEGVFDLLSYLELEIGKSRNKDYMVLNSLVNIKKSMDILRSYETVDLMLDRDEGGRKATTEIRNALGNCRDLSDWYKPFKDVNDYHLKR